MGGFPVRNVDRLCLAHFWVAFGAFLFACLIGTWQMWVRSPLGAKIGTPGQYFMSVTAHGVSMAYVLTTFFIMGFGYFVAVTALNRPLPGRLWAWAAFWIALLGVVVTIIPIGLGRASVLFTFYPPLTASVWFYIGLVLVVAASWIWCVLMLVAMNAWKRENPGRPVPLAMFATVANAVMWLWTTVGVAAQLVFQVIPAALGTRPDHRCRLVADAVLMDAARDRVFLADTGLHRLLHHGTARRRRTTLQRHHGSPDIHSLPDLQPAGRHASSADGSGTWQRDQIHPGLVDGVRGRSDPADDLHHHGFARDRGTSARRPRRVRLDRGASLGPTDGAGHRPRLHHARIWRFRRHHQHGLWHERDGAQHLVGHRAFPSHLWRLGGDHVLRHRL